MLFFLQIIYTFCSNYFVLLDDEFHTFRWEQYLKSTGSVAAPKHFFKTVSMPVSVVFDALKQISARVLELISDSLLFPPAQLDNGLDCQTTNSFW